MPRGRASYHFLTAVVRIEPSHDLFPALWVQTAWVDVGMSRRDDYVSDRRRVIGYGDHLQDKGVIAGAN